MRYKVCLEVVVDENNVEGALAETMMIARALCEYPAVWPRIHRADWTFDSRQDKDWKDGPQVLCSVTKIKKELTK
jgi:hypothetical protein